MLIQKFGKEGGNMINNSIDTANGCIFLLTLFF